MFAACAIRQEWKRFDKAFPGSPEPVPRPEPCAKIQGNYRIVHDMIPSASPDFQWIMEQSGHTQITAKPMQHR